MPWYKNPKIIILMIVIFIIFAFFSLIAYGTFLINLEQNNLNLTERLKLQKQYKVSEKNSYWLGSNNPKLTIVEFSDFSCPACKSIYPKIREIILKYSKDVKIVYKDFPIISEDSLGLSLAARCAGEQNLFWMMHDKLFENQGKIDNNRLNLLIREIGVDVNKFNICLESQKYLKDIQVDFLEGDSFGIKATPILFINGYKVIGDIPMESLIEIVEEFIK